MFCDRDLGGNTARTMMALRLSRLPMGAAAPSAATALAATDGCSAACLHGVCGGHGTAPSTCKEVQHP